MGEAFLTRRGTLESEGLYVWKKLSAQGGDTIGYVVSDEPNKYPDGAVQDGYYYERVVEAKVTPEMFGGTKIEVCTWTATSSSTIPTTTIGHSLGKAPFLVMMFTRDIKSYTNDMYVPFVVSWSGGHGSPNTNALNGTKAASAYADSSSAYVNCGSNSHYLVFTSTNNTIQFSSDYSNMYTREGATYYLILVA